MTSSTLLVNKSLTEGLFPSVFKNAHVIKSLSIGLQKESFNWNSTPPHPWWYFNCNGQGPSHGSHFVGLVRSVWYHQSHHTFRQITELVWYIWPCTKLVIFILDGQESTDQGGRCPFFWSSASFWCPPSLRAWTTALYTVHTALSTAIQVHPIMHHLYAYNSHLSLCIYRSPHADDSANQLDSLKFCLDSVLNWMFHNRLKLNPSKTDFLLIGHEEQRKKYLSRFPITLMGIDGNPSASARNLGVAFDQKFNFRKRVSQVCNSCFYHAYSWPAPYSSRSESLTMQNHYT